MSKGSPIRERLQRQIRYGEWDTFSTFKEGYLYADAIAGKVASVTGDKEFSKYVESKINSLPYGLIYRFPLLIAWRPVRALTEPGTIKRGMVAGLADDCPLKEILPAGEEAVMPPELQKWAYMFFRLPVETRYILFRLELRKAVKLGIQFPFRLTDERNWCLVILRHPRAPVCFVSGLGDCYVCTVHGYWRMTFDTFCSEILPLSGSAAGLRALMLQVEGKA